MTEKRFTIKDSMLKNGYVIIDNEKEYTFPVLDSTLNYMFCKALNELHEENQLLQRHIKRNTFNKIRVEDILNCAKYDKFYDDKEAIKSIDWIAEQLGVDLE